MTAQSFPLIFTILWALLFGLTAAPVRAGSSLDWPEWKVPNNARLLLVDLEQARVEGLRMKVAEVSSPWKAKRLIHWYQDQWQMMDPEAPEGLASWGEDWVIAGQVVGDYFLHIQLDARNALSSLGFLGMSYLPDLETTQRGPSPNDLLLPPAATRLLWQERNDQSVFSQTTIFEIDSEPKAVTQALIERARSQGWVSETSPAENTPKQGETLMTLKRGKETRYLVIEQTAKEEKTRIVIVSETR